MPRGVAHVFKVTSAEPARYVNVQGPTGDVQELIPETQASMAQKLPAEESAARQAILSKKHGIEILALLHRTDVAAGPGRYVAIAGIALPGTRLLSRLR